MSYYEDLLEQQNMALAAENRILHEENARLLAVQEELMSNIQFALPAGIPSDGELVSFSMIRAALAKAGKEGFKVECPLCDVTTPHTHTL
jgi:hypothetical protein